MNIHIVGPAHPYRGGIAKFNDVLSENLMAQGHKVKMVNFSMQYPSFLFPGRTQYTTSPAPTDVEMVRSVSSINPLSWYKTARMIRRDKPDLVIVRYWTPFMAPALGSIARWCGCKVIALADNIVPHERHFWDSPLTRYFLGSVQGVVYMSRQVGEELSEFKFKGHKAFSPHPIYDTYGQKVSKTEAAISLGLDPDLDYIMFFGFIRDYKGLDTLLKAWSLLPLEFRADKRLLVAGEFYEPRAKYDDIINLLHLEHEVVVCDKYIKEEDVRLYFSISDLVVQPYKTATQSGVTQVAYYFGTPMIVTNVGGLAEIVSDGKVGFVVDVEPEAIAQAIKKFYDQDLKNEFVRGITQEKERFTWKRMTEILTTTI